VSARRILLVASVSVVVGLLSAALVLVCAARGGDVGAWHAPLAADLPLTRALPQPQGTEVGGVRVVESGVDGVVLELKTPTYLVSRTTSDEGACLRIHGSGTGGYTSVAGAPELPVQGAMLGVPPDARVTLTVIETRAVDLPVELSVCPVARPALELGRDGELRPVGSVRAHDAEAYASDGWYPEEEAVLVSTGYVRSQRVAQIRFHPVRYNPATGRLQHLAWIRVRVSFDRAAAQSASTAAGAVDEGTFEGILSQALVNYAQAREWRTSPAGRALDQALTQEEGPRAKITVQSDGLYEVTYADLLAAGVDLGDVDPDRLRLTSQGEDVALGVSDDGLVFYGEQARTRWARTNAYWLSWDGPDGTRIREESATPGGTAMVPAHYWATQVVERDLFYQSNHPSPPDGDLWYWNVIWASEGPMTAMYTATLDSVATGSLSATLRGRFSGYAATAPQGHHTQVYLNGRAVDDAYWVSGTEHAFEAQVPQSYLVEGTNAISVTCGSGLGSGQYDVVFVNGFSIDYHAKFGTADRSLFFGEETLGTWEYRVSGWMTSTVDVYDVSMPRAPVRLLDAVIDGSGPYTVSFERVSTGASRYLVTTERLQPVSIELVEPSGLRTPERGADYLIITHSDFYTAVQPLADRRAAQGLRVAMVDVRDAYDEFGDGLFGPDGIRNLIAYAYANWQPPAPSYVLLVGDGHYDPLDNLGRGEPIYVPPYLAYVDPWKGETAADNRYVCVSGDDTLPDMHLGRLPVKTADEATVLVNKILAYEQTPPSGGWRERLLFVADNADTAGDFAAFSDHVADNYVPEPYVADKVYHGITYADGEDTRAAVRQAINEGRLVVNYIGHAAYSQWGNYEEQFLSVADVPWLANEDRQPFMVPMTCLEGYYIVPSPPETDLAWRGITLCPAPRRRISLRWARRLCAQRGAGRSRAGPPRGSRTWRVTTCSTWHCLRRS